jgi:ElaB/YqjD/DUF883 family membrane-anchored ribosome-binding protein
MTTSTMKSRMVAAMPPGSVTPDQAEALRALGELVEELLQRGRQLVADGMAPMAAVDRVVREADPRSVIAAAVIGLLAGVVTDPPEAEATGVLH